MNIINSITTFELAKAALEELFKLLSSVAYPQRITLENQKGIVPHISTKHLWKEHPFGDFEIAFFEPDSEYLFFEDSRLVLRMHWANRNASAISSRDPQGIGQTEFLRLELLTAHLNTGRKKRGLLGPDTTVFLRSELLSVDYYFNRGRVARKIKHNGVPLEKFPDSDCATACPATISVVGFLEDILEEEFPNFEVEEYFKRMPSFW